MTFEEVHQHVQSVDPAIFPKTIDPLGPAIQLCPIYKAIRPILALFVMIPFFPASWKAVVQGFMDTMDKVCP